MCSRWSECRDQIGGKENQLGKSMSVLRYRVEERIRNERSEWNVRKGLRRSPRGDTKFKCSR